MILCHLLMFFFKSAFSKTFYREYDLNVKRLGYSLRSGPTFFGSDLGPNRLQTLSADNKSRRKQAKN